MAKRKTLPAAVPEYQEPHDAQAERRVLGLCLEHPQRDVPAARAIVAAEDFFVVPHQLLFRRILEEFDSGITEELEFPARLLARLRDHGELEAVGGPAYVSSLIQS